MGVGVGVGVSLGGCGCGCVVFMCFWVWGCADVCGVGVYICKCGGYGCVGMCGCVWVCRYVWLCVGVWGEGYSQNDLSFTRCLLKTVYFVFLFQLFNIFSFIYASVCISVVYLLTIIEERHETKIETPCHTTNKIFRLIKG